jgi:rsbT co-antagonist protein RsbR
VPSSDPRAALTQQLGITDTEIARRLELVEFKDTDARWIQQLSAVVTPRAVELSAGFFDYLSTLDEARVLLQNRQAMTTARRMKEDHIRAMVTGAYGVAYAEERLQLGMLYAKVGLDPRIFLSAYHHLLQSIAARVIEHMKGEPSDALSALTALNKVAFFDLSLIIDVIVFERERLIHQQQEAIRELSTPVLQIRDRLLILPIIGMVDTQRARQITESLLRAIRSHRAKVVVLDITGVPIVDSKVANHLMQTIMAGRLMGATAIVTGLSADVAQALVTLGVSLGDVITAGDLQGGLEEAERLLDDDAARRARSRPASES